MQHAPVRGPETPDLFDHAESALAQSFREFHDANPHVYTRLRDLALSYLARHLFVGVGHLYEVVRYERFQTTGDWFKLNNNHRSRYARLLMECEPRLKDYFETRELTS